MNKLFMSVLNKHKKATTKKMYAAISLLLITVVLISATTYAWIVMSSAPEVTGVDTLIGSNGNLEIALNVNDLTERNLNGLESLPIGLESVYERNPYWGNLIDLSDRRYGIQEIELKPAMLNMVDQAENLLNLDAPIQIAGYDADGRIVGMDTTDAMASYNYLDEQFTMVTNYGVRASGEQHDSAMLRTGAPNQPVGNTYAFCIDLLLRTNVSDANLLLQTDPIDRNNHDDGIPDEWYDDPSEDKKRGFGSKITVSNSKLRSAIRVAFTDTLTGEVYATASADSQGYLHLVDRPYIPKIKPLEQNKVTALTVWIYLDGNVVGNANVHSMNARELEINLQFATDVELRPSHGTTDKIYDKEGIAYYFESQAGGAYAYYLLDASGARAYEVAFEGTVDQANRSIVIDSLDSTPYETLQIPALLTDPGTDDVYTVSLKTDKPIRNKPSTVEVISLDDVKVGLVGTDLSDFLGDAREHYRTMDLSGLDTSNVTDMWNMFAGCSGLTELNVTGFNTSKVTNMVGMFDNCSNLTELDLSSFDTSQVLHMSLMFSDCSGLTELDVTSFDTWQVGAMDFMFENCSGLTELDVTGFETWQVGTMRAMFIGCSGLTELDVTGFDTSNVEDMGDMFYGCSSLTELDITGFDTSEVTTMASMFYYCHSLTELDVTGFDTSNVTLIGDMFNGCFSLTELDVTGFNTANVKDMGGMFEDCHSLTELDVTGFDTSNVMLMDYMFYGCSSLTQLDVTGFNTSKVIAMIYMFYGCSGLTELDITGFDTANVEFMNGMFMNCTSLAKLITGPLWDTSNADVTDMYTGTLLNP